jgi:hypothetical protein
MPARSEGNLRMSKKRIPLQEIGSVPFVLGNTSVFISSIEEKRNFGNTPNTFASLEIHSKIFKLIIKIKVSAIFCPAF